MKSVIFGLPNDVTCVDSTDPFCLDKWHNLTSRRDVFTSFDNFWARLLTRRARRGRARQRSGIFILLIFLVSLKVAVFQTRLFQGGAYFEVFSAQGKDPVSHWKLSSTSAIRKVRGYRKTPNKRPLPINAPPHNQDPHLSLLFMFSAISQPKMIRFSFCKKLLKGGNALFQAM